MHMLEAFQAVERRVGLHGDGPDGGIVFLEAPVVPMKVPLVPKPTTKWVTCPEVWARISGRWSDSGPASWHRWSTDRRSKSAAGRCRPFPARGEWSVRTLVWLSPLHLRAVGVQNALPLQGYVGGQWPVETGIAQRRAEHGQAQCRCCRWCVKQCLAWHQQAARLASPHRWPRRRGSLTLPPGLAHSALPNTVTPRRPRTTWSRRRAAWEPMRCGTDEPSSVCGAVVFMAKLQAAVPVCEIGDGEESANPAATILADQEPTMSKRPALQVSIRCWIHSAPTRLMLRLRRGRRGVVVSKHGAGRFWCLARRRMRP